MSVLNISLLGTPEIQWDKKIITIPRRMSRAMLFYLAAHRFPISRDEVLSVLWDQQPASKSRLRLNESLSRLKTSLPSSDLVLTEGDTLGLDYEQVLVDLHAFEDWINQAGATPWQIPKNEPLPSHTTQYLQSAIDLWRGDKFMAGSALPSTPIFDDWLLITGSRLTRLRISILERLAEHAYVIRDLERAIQNAQQALQFDEYNTNLHYRVMACLIEQGNNNQAKEYYEYVLKLLQEDLNSRPPDDLISLYKSIIKNNEPKLFGSLNGWMGQNNSKVPFIGRKDILVKIRQILNQHKCLCIIGEAGQGKTRLIQEYLSLLHPEPLIMMVSCQPLEMTLPFQPLCDAFREYIQPQEWRSFSPIWASHLVPLLPEQAQNQNQMNASSIPMDSAQTQATLLEAIRQVFIWYLKDQTFYLILDNAHWADEATLSAIAYLYSRPPFDQNGHLVVLANQEEQSSSLKILYSVSNTQYVEILQLPSLESQDVAELTQLVLHNSPSQVFIENIVRSTGGNTLFIIETLHSILENYPEPDLSGDVEIPVPESITHIIQSRIRKLTPAIQVILENAAVLGSEFELNTLADLLDQPLEAITQAIEELEKRLILRVLFGASGVPRYRFNHEVFRQTVLNSMSPARKMVIHNNVAAVLAENSQPQQTAILAYHHQAAGKLTEAFHYWIAAGDQARERQSISDVHLFYSQAESLLQDIEDELTNDDLYRLYMPWYEMAYISHNTSQVRTLGNHLKKLGRKRKSNLLIGTALCILSAACMTENKLSTGLDFASRAIPYLERSGHLFGHMEAYTHLGTFLYMLNRLDDAASAFEKALAIGKEESTPQMVSARANAYYQMSLLKTLAGWPKIGWQFAQLSLEDANITNRKFLQFPVYFILALACYHMGQYHKARDYIRMGIDLVEPIRGLRLLGYYHGCASAVALILGNVDSALKNAKKTLQFGEEYSLNDVIALGYRHMADVYTILKAPRQAIQYYERGVMEANGHFLGIDNQMRLGYVQAISGESEKGHQNLALSLTASQNTGLGLGMILTQHLQSIAYLAGNNLEEAGRLSHKIQLEAQERGLFFEWLSASKTLALIRLKSGDSEAAVKQLRDVAQHAMSIGMIWLELESLLELEKALHCQGLSDPFIRTRLKNIKTHLAAKTKEPCLQKYINKILASIDRGYLQR